MVAFTPINPQLGRLSFLGESRWGPMRRGWDADGREPLSSHVSTGSRSLFQPLAVSPQTSVVNSRLRPLPGSLLSHLSGSVPSALCLLSPWHGSAPAARQAGGRVGVGSQQNLALVSLKTAHPNRRGSSLLVFSCPRPSKARPGLIGSNYYPTPCS